MTARLTSKIKSITAAKRIGIMSHVIVGYPNRQDCLRLCTKMIAAGADILELQIPFSDPIADGPVILGASDLALKQGVNFTDALDLASQLRAKHPETPLLFMGYANTVLHFGIEEFVRLSVEAGVDGFIIPDLPADEPEGKEFLAANEKYRTAPILILTPVSSPERLQLCAEKSRGFVYIVSRTGVTGKETSFSDELSTFLVQCRKITDLPLAVGFGISTSEHVRFLRGKAEIAVVGSATLRILQEKGVPAAAEFIGELKEAGEITNSK